MNGYYLLKCFFDSHAVVVAASSELGLLTTVEIRFVSFCGVRHSSTSSSSSTHQFRTFYLLICLYLKMDEGLFHCSIGLWVESVKRELVIKLVMDPGSHLDLLPSLERLLCSWQIINFRELPSSFWQEFSISPWMQLEQLLLQSEQLKKFHTMPFAYCNF